MRKSTIFISAVLTTFVMAMLAGVASAYSNIVNPEQQQTTVQIQPQTVPIQNSPPAEAPIPVQPGPVNITPEQAADLAAQVIGRDDLFSVEVTDFNGETVYLVTFSSGDLVYVSLDGQIRSIGKLEVKTVIINSGRNRNDNNTSSGTSGGHDDDDDHDEHDEDDDD